VLMGPLLPGHPSPAQAMVTYNVLLSGTTALSNQTGVAAYQNGTWKVGDVSFCGLLTLESGGKAPSGVVGA
jgi:hypothetical protein